MNLNEAVMKRGKGRGNRCILTKFKPDRKKISEIVSKKFSPTSAASDINWGKNHISITNSSSSKKSAGSHKYKNEDFGSRIIVALTEGRGEARCEIGIAAISVSMPFLILCQISDSQNYINTLTKINILNPSEILVPNTFVEHFSGNRLINKVKERFPNLKYVGVPRSTYNKLNGFEMLNNLCIPSLNGILLVLQHRYYALAAASALITYIQDHVFIYYAPGTIKVDYQESEGYAVIDVSTADYLELVSSTRPAQGNKYASLFGVLNHCQTKIGARMLRSIILQPPFKAEYIENRLRCVDELIENKDMLTCIQVLLIKMSNIDSLLSLGTMISNDPLKSSISHLNYILRLNSILDIITPLKENLESFTQPFFLQISKTLANQSFSDIKNMLRQTIQEDAQPARGNGAMLQRCFVIKPGINGLLDLVRKTYTERLNDLKEYVKSLAEKYDLSLTLGNNQTKGYHIVLSLSKTQKKTFKKSDLPDEFIEVHCSTGCRTMKTPELVNLSTRLDDIMTDILKISNVMIHGIIVHLKKHIHLFYILCEEIAQLDVIQSLASTSLMNDYVRPTFSEFTEISHARHPLLDILLINKPVSNHVTCSDDFNVNIITGPNGSGKSVFIRQVLLLQVMAQVGCYVPAQSATFKPMDRMFARIYLEDNMEFGASSFILEMKEMNYIMTSLTKNSLVIIDELGRSTALEEGTALAIAILEKLANSSAYIYIATHFTLLTRLYDMYPYVKIWQLETIPKDQHSVRSQLDYKYNVLPGVTSIKHYGVTLVRDIWPNDILEYVDCLMRKISKEHDRNVLVIDEKSRLKYSVEAMFRKLKLKNELTISKINEIITQYQVELKQLGYVLNINSLESNPRENLPLVDDNSVNNLETYPNPALDRFLDDSNSFCHNQNNSYQYMSHCGNKNVRQNFIESDVFKKPAPPKNTIKSIHSQVESIHNGNYEELLSPSFQLTPSVVLSNDMDDHQFSMSFCNDLSKTSTPVNFFDNICHYSSSSNASQEPSFSVQNDAIDVYNDSRHHNVENFQADLHSENVSSNYLYEIDNLREEDEVSVDDYIHRNHYEHYISPTVKIIQGLDNKSSSWEDQSENEFSNPNCISESKINIISDIKILSGHETVESKEPQNNYEDNDVSKVLSHSELDKSYSVITGASKDPNVSLEKSFQTLPRKIVRSPVERIISQTHSGTPKVENMNTSLEKSAQTASEQIVRSPIDKITSQTYSCNENDHEGADNIKHGISEIGDESQKHMALSPSFVGYEGIAVNRENVLNISDASTWKINAPPDSENLPNSLDSTLSLDNGHMVLPANKEYDNQKCILRSGRIRANDSIRSSTSIIMNDNPNCTDFEKGKTIRRGYNTERDSNVSYSSLNDTNDSCAHESYHVKGLVPSHEFNVSETSVFRSPLNSINKMNEENKIKNFTFKKKKQFVSTAIFNNYLYPSSQHSSQSNHDMKEHSNNSQLMSDSNSSKMMTMDENVTYSNVFNDLIQYEPNRPQNYSLGEFRENSGGSAKTRNVLNTTKMDEDDNKNTTYSSTSKDLQYMPIIPKNGSTITETNAVDIRNGDETTSMSVASKMRKLGEDVTYSSSSNYLDKISSAEKSRSLDNENSQIYERNKLETSVSYASELRTLDEGVTYSSAFAEKSSSVDNKDDQILKSSIDNATALNVDENNTDISASDDQSNNKHSSSLTSLSSASKKRNLDNVSSSAITKSAASTEHIKVSNNIEDKSSRNCTRLELGMAKHTKLARKRFIPPRTLSAKEITTELEEQGRKILESSQNSSNMKYWKHIVNRPTVKQIRNSTQLALVRKTNDGVEIFPTNHNTKKPRKKTPMKRHFSNENFDMSIFSDKNAKTFEEYLNSGERDYNTFRSRINQCVEENSSSNFNQFGYSLNLVRDPNEDNFVLSGSTATPFYSSQSSAISFSRPQSYPDQNTSFNIATFNATIQNNKVASNTEQIDFTSLTPNGFYKQNKEHINTIMNKYLQNQSISSQCENNVTLNSRDRRNIFENTNLNIEDLSI
ncbi:unnamed protein product [Phaedon cochleariae]|uniref:DNA mismatch repair proteins mutS family domain-containing protein n=1 Tax=Phaedon cochleariae TaxID=80249 RepID=A0A9N9WZT2_PHACE|nr:unnamed protein product [Phaedon cochleariae]